MPKKNNVLGLLAKRRFLLESQEIDFSKSKKKKLAEIRTELSSFGSASKRRLDLNSRASLFQKKAINEFLSKSIPSSELKSLLIKLDSVHDSKSKVNLLSSIKTHLGTNSKNPLLVKVMNSFLLNADANVASEITCVLGSIKTKSSAMLLVKLLRHKDSDVRGMSASALSLLSKLKFSSIEKNHIKKELGKLFNDTEFTSYRARETYSYFA